MSIKNQPLVSIGIPVFNGEKYITEALDAIVNQTYKNIEIIISDNASTDKTQSICQVYQKKYGKIKYFRFNENQGAAINFNKSFELSSGKYFKWASHDDFIERTYIEKCVTYLENNHDTHLCHSRKTIVNQYGISVKKLNYEGLEINQNMKFYRFKAFLSAFRYFQDDADIVFGVFRSSELSKTHKIASYNSSDLTLTAEIVLLGQIHILHEYLFNRRFHQKMSTVAHNSKSSRAQWFSTRNRKQSLPQYFPYMIWFYNFNKFIVRSEMTFSQKLVLSLSTIQWLIFRIYYRISIKFRFKHPSEFGKVHIDIT